VVVSFICGENKSTQSKPQTWCKSRQILLQTVALITPLPWQESKPNFSSDGHWLNKCEQIIIHILLKERTDIKDILR
jgi:hypothetical protein